VPNIFQTNWLIGIGVVLIFSFIANGINHTWERHKLRDNAQRAVSRLRKLKHGNQLEPEEIQTLIEDIFEPEGQLNPERAMKPALPPQVGSKIHKSLNGNAPKLDEIDALVQEILEDQDQFKGSEPLRFRTSVSTVLDGGERLELQTIPHLPQRAGTKI
jgi:hypothetical protein